MITPRVPTIDEPRAFGPDELFFSLTDPKGIIRYGNRVFTRVSGYSEEQLIGQPHNLIRHPDVPRCVFRLLWDYLNAGRTIAAYVKNLAADGRYYWVLATVMPCEGGYLSVRLNPSSPYFDAAKKLYSEVLKYESVVEHTSGKQEAIAESLQRAVAALNELGFDDYDTFMRAALRAELTGDGPRVAAIEPHGAADETTQRVARFHASLAEVGDRLAQVFGSLDLFESLSERLAAKHQTMDELGPSLTFLALNTQVSASRLGDGGAVLSVISRVLGERSKHADRLLGTLVGRMGPVGETAREIAFDVEVAQLETRVCTAFAEELLEDISQTQGRGFNESLRSLTGELTARSRLILDGLRRLEREVDVMAESARDLVGEIGQMQTTQLNGRIDIAARRNAEGFRVIFDDVGKVLTDASKDCNEILELLDETKDEIRQLLAVETALHNDLAAIDASAEAVTVSA